MNDNERLNQVLDVLLGLSSGKLKKRVPFSGESDDLDAIASAVNMMGEELEENVVSRSFLENIFQAVPDMLFVLGPDYRIEKVNPAVSKILGWDTEKLLNFSFKKLFNPDSPDTLTDDCLSSGSSFSNRETVMINSKGRNIPVLLSVKLPTEEHESYSAICLAKDITDLKLAKKGLEKKNNDLNTFFYKLSHDLRGPVASIMGVLNQNPENADPELLSNYLEMIHDQASKLNRLLHEMSEFNIIINKPIEVTSLKPVQILREIEEELYDEFNQAGAELNIESQLNENFSLKSDSVILKRILYNLVLNAIQFRKQDIQKPLVTVRLKNSNPVIIEVEDNGMGIPGEKHAELFDMFYKAHRSSKGSGLGLFTVREGVEKLGGKAEIKKSSDEGTTFSIEIPANYSGSEYL